MELVAPGFEPPLLANPGPLTVIERGELVAPGLMYEVISPTLGSEVRVNNPCPIANIG